MVPITAMCSSERTLLWVSSSDICIRQQVKLTYLLSLSGSTVLVVTATDVDGGALTFHIDPLSSLVAIPHSSSGVVTLAISPDREVYNHVLYMLHFMPII